MKKQKNNNKNVLFSTKILQVQQFNNEELQTFQNAEIVFGFIENDVIIVNNQKKECIQYYFSSTKRSQNHRKIKSRINNLSRVLKNYKVLIVTKDLVKYDFPLERKFRSGEKAIPINQKYHDVINFSINIASLLYVLKLYFKFNPKFKLNDISNKISDDKDEILRSKIFSSELLKEQKIYKNVDYIEYAKYKLGVFDDNDAKSQYIETCVSKYLKKKNKKK